MTNPPTDPREPIIRRLAERLGVPVEAIAEGRGDAPPLIAVDIEPAPFEVEGMCRWRSRLTYTPDRSTIAVVEIREDGTVTELGTPPADWEPPITISPADLVAALNDAARDIDQLMREAMCDCKCTWRVVHEDGTSSSAVSFVKASMLKRAGGDRVERVKGECTCQCPACDDAVGAAADA